MGRLAKWIGLGLLAASGLACNDTSFKSSGGKRTTENAAAKTGRNKADKTLKLACAAGSGDAQLVTEVKGAESTTVRLEGEFCGLPAAAEEAEVTVFFVIDISGSMNTSDPLTAGSCGRLQAGQAIIAKLEEIAGQGAKVQVGMQMFGSLAAEAVPPQPLEQFKSRLTAGAFCRMDGQGTNYEAAFSSSQQQLQGSDGTKVVYFISDGFPSVSGNQPTPIFAQPADLKPTYDAGVRAAESLRQLPDLTLNVIYLQSRELEEQARQEAGQSIEAPEQYLGRVAGEADRVKLVNSASDLAAQIVTFKDPADLTLDQSSVKGEVEAGSLGRAKVKLASLTKDPDRNGIWLFATEPFTLYGKVGKTVENKVTLRVKGTGGKDYAASAVIKFEAKD